MESESNVEGATRSIRWPFDTIGRTEYVVGMFLLWAASYGVGALLGPPSQAIGFIALVLLVLIVVANRLRDIGLNGWWVLLTLVPGPNVVIGVSCLALPEKFRDHRKLDTGAWVVFGIAGVFLLLIAFAWLQ